MSVGLFLSSYAPSILFLYISYGLLLGIGTSLCATMALIVSADYFDKHLSLATGIVASGSSFGTLVFPPTLQILVERYGWQTTFRIMGLGGILMAITGLVYRSVNRNHVPLPANRNQFFDTSVLKNRAFVLWIIATTVAGFGYFIPHFFLVRKKFSEQSVLAQSSLPQFVFEKDLLEFYLDPRHSLLCFLVRESLGSRLQRLLKVHADDGGP